MLPGQPIPGINGLSTLMQTSEMVYMTSHALHDGGNFNCNAVPHGGMHIGSVADTPIKKVQ